MKCGIFWPLLQKLTYSLCQFPDLSAYYVQWFWYKFRLVCCQFLHWLVEVATYWEETQVDICVLRIDTCTCRYFINHYVVVQATCRVTANSALKFYYSLISMPICTCIILCEWSHEHVQLCDADIYPVCICTAGLHVSSRQFVCDQKIN